MGLCISDNFKDVAKIASSHHEKYDGTGYFKGLKGEQIPLGGRILAVSDVFDAITSKRHYRDKMNIKDALQIMIEGKNRHFDENLVNAFLNISTYEILKIIVNDITCDFSEDEILLKEFNLLELYDILKKEENSITKKEKQLTESFNKYYYYNSKN